jgi:hypothetical protein
MSAMANFTQINTLAMRLQNQIAPWQGNGSLVLASQKTRPLWFDGRFLAARDLERDQDYFLQRQAALGRAAGFGVIHGLLVDRVSSGGQAPDAETIIVRAGQGITPGGGLVMISSDLTVRISDLAEEESLDVQFGLSTSPTPVARTRTGLYVIALRPVQFTANPIASYPTSIQGSPTLQDGDIVEATAVSLVPYPTPSSNFEAATQNAAVARQVFVEGNAGPLSDALLPLAMISIQDGAIVWLDCYLVRRESGPEFGDLRFGLSDPAAQQAFLLQYDAQLQQAVAPFLTSNTPARFAATDHFQALPPAGRFPLASIDTTSFTQLFFPQQTDVRLSLVPDDELPALIEDSLSLPPIDLTQPASAYADLAVFALVPVPRASLAALSASLAPVALSAALPQVQTPRTPAGLLRLFRGVPAVRGGGTPPTPSTIVINRWQLAIGNQIYGYYIRRRSSPIFASPDSATASTSTILTAAPIAGRNAVTLTATVSPAGATGTVTFKDGTTALGTVDLTANGTAVLIVPAFTSGTHQLTAVYNGSANFTGSTSATVTETAT